MTILGRIVRERPAHRQQELVRHRSHVRFSVAYVTIFGLKSQGKISGEESRGWREAAHGQGFDGAGRAERAIFPGAFSRARVRTDAESGETHPGR